MQVKRGKERINANRAKAIREKAEAEKKQKEQASHLEKLQREQEEQMNNQLYQNQTNYSVNPAPIAPQNQFVMPGTAVQPTYQSVNPYAGNHNYQAVPVIYDPSQYGIQYDNQLPVSYQPGSAASSTQMGQTKPMSGGKTSQIHPYGKIDETNGQLL